MLAARLCNDRAATTAMRLCLLASFVLACAAAGAGFWGPWSHAMDPTRHVYPAIVWILVIWVLAHAALGAVMQLYCLARSIAGRLTNEHDMDLHNVVLYWHFLLIAAVTTFAVVGLFPRAL